MPPLKAKGASSAFLLQAVNFDGRLREVSVKLLGYGRDDRLEGEVITLTSEIGFDSNTLTEPYKVRFILIHQLLVEGARIMPHRVSVTAILQQLKVPSIEASF